MLPVYPQSGYDLTSIFFLDPMTGWASAKYGVLFRTTDGGATWAMSFDPGWIGQQKAYKDVAFTDALVGLAVGTGGRIMRTTDGGVTWNAPVGLNIPDLYILDLSDVHWLSSTEAWILGMNGLILRTVDQGVTWSILDQRRLSGGAFAFQGPYAWVIGGCGMIVRTAIPDLITSLPTASPQETAPPMLYPNPSRSGVIHWPTSVAEGTSVEVRILNMLGACAHTSSVKAGASGLLDVSSGNLAPGSYIITATTSATTVSARLQIEREE